jgi:hypothetical protein
VKTANRPGSTGFGPVHLIPKHCRFASLTKPKLSASLSLFRFFPPHAASPSHSHARRLTHRLTISSHRLTITPHTSSQSRRLTHRSRSLTLRLNLTISIAISHSQTQTHCHRRHHSAITPPSLSRSHGCSLSLYSLLTDFQASSPFFKKAQSVSLSIHCSRLLSLSL